MKGYTGELKGIITSKKLFIAIIGIILMPLLYGGLLIWSFWDPYGQLENLPVAVVNEDTGAEVNGEKIEAGNDFVKELSKDSSLAFDFVSKEEAQRGLKDHSYYFYVEIPKTFSEEIGSVTETYPAQANIYYDINEDYNYVSSQIAETAIEEIEQELSGALTAAYVEIANDAFSELTQAVSALQKGSLDVAEGNQKAEENIRLLNEGLVSLTKGSEEVDKGVYEAASGSNQLLTGAEEVHYYLHESEEGKEIKEVFELAAEKTEKGIVLLEDSDAEEIGDSFKKVNNHLGEIHGLLAQADDSIHDITVKASEVQQRTEEIYEEIDKVLYTVEGHASSLTSSIDEISTALLEWEEFTKKIEGKMEDPLNALEDIHYLLKELPSLLDEEYPEWRESEELTAWYNNITMLLPEHEGEEIQQAFQSMQEQVREIEEGMATKKEEVNQVLASVEEDAAEYRNTISHFNKEIQQMSDELILYLEDVQGVIQSAQSSLPHSLNEGQMEEELEVMNDSVLEVLYDVHHGLSDIESFYEGVVVAEEEAYEGIKALNNGLQALETGSTELSNGLGEAEEGGIELAEGLNELRDGSEDLNASLTNLSDMLMDYTPSENQEKMVANPVQSKSPSPAADYSYGEGLTPYFLSIGLYVGGLTLSIIYPFRTPLASHENGWQWFRGKFGVAVTVGILQSMLVAVFLLFIIGLSVENTAGFILFSLFTSIVFVSIVFCLVGILDNPGRFIAIILLILQLGGSAGSFPVELLASPLQSLHGWLPMTYSVLGFRASIFMDSTPLLVESVWRLSIMMGAVLLASTFFYLKNTKNFACHFCPMKINHLIELPDSRRLYFLTSKVFGEGACII